MERVRNAASVEIVAKGNEVSTGNEVTGLELSELSSWVVEFMKEKLLTFEISKNLDEIDIHGNQQGLSELLEIIGNVIKSRQHDHLMTKSWGGDELSDERQDETATLINKGHNSLLV
jgi:hypothetical protein